MRCIDASAMVWYPKHHKPVQLGHGEGEGAKGAQTDREGQKDVRGFQFKIFALCYITSFDEVGREFFCCNNMCVCLMLILVSASLLLRRTLGELLQPL